MMITILLKTFCCERALRVCTNLLYYCTKSFIAGTICRYIRVCNNILTYTVLYTYACAILYIHMYMLYTVHVNVCTYTMVNTHQFAKIHFQNVVDKAVAD